MKSIKIIVHGKVQGVFYRKHTLEKAQDLHLKGFVMNRDDGTVFIKASGSVMSIKELIDWCQEGSPMSQVTAVDSEDIDDVMEADFYIKR